MFVTAEHLDELASQLDESYKQAEQATELIAKLRLANRKMAARVRAMRREYDRYLASCS